MAQLFCAKCRRHYPGQRTVCPADGVRLVPVAGERPIVGAAVGERYILGREIASGGMASIFAALDREAHGEVALKLLRTRFLTSPSLVEQFYAEARAIRRIDHPNVVSMLDFGRSAEGRLYIAMELIEGPPLSDVLWERGALSIETSLRVFLQVADALRAAHAVGVIHADLKAGNVLFASPDPKDERVKVLDFGIARLHHLEAKERRGESAGTPIVGTPQYMSPEQVAQEEVDPRSDLYSAGILLFHLLTGQVPFEHEDPAEVCRRQREEAPPRVAQMRPGGKVPFAVEHLVGRLLAKDPEARPATAEEVIGETREILARLGVPDAPVETPSAPAPLDLRTGPLVANVFEFEQPLAMLEAHSRKPAEGAGAGNTPKKKPLPQGVVAEEVALLVVEFLGDDRPFTLLDGQTVDLAFGPVVDAFEGDVKQAGGVMLERSLFQLRAGFVLGSFSAGERPAALDLALALLGRVDVVEKGLGIGLAARCGVATGPVFRDPSDQLGLGTLVKGALPDVSARLVRLAPWGGVAFDRASLVRAQTRLDGVDSQRIRARGAPRLTVFSYVPRKG